MGDLDGWVGDGPSFRICLTNGIHLLEMDEWMTLILSFYSLSSSDP